MLFVSSGCVIIRQFQYHTGDIAAAGSYWCKKLLPECCISMCLYSNISYFEAWTITALEQRYMYDWPVLIKPYLSQTHSLKDKGEVTEMHKYRMKAEVLKVQTQHGTAGIRGINNSSMVIKLVWPCEMLKSVLGIAETTLKYRALYRNFTHNMELWTHGKGGSRCWVKNNAKTDPMQTQEQGGIDDEHHSPDKGHGMLINGCPSFSLQ